MKAINRLYEAKISKHSKYINVLIPKINESLRINLSPMISPDPYTYKFRSLSNQDKEFMTVILELTTNRMNLDGIMWGTFNIMGRKFDIGDLYGNVEDDLAIIEDSFFDFFDQLENRGEKLSIIDLK